RDTRAEGQPEEQCEHTGPADECAEEDPEAACSRRHRLRALGGAARRGTGTADLFLGHRPPLERVVALRGVARCAAAVDERRLLDVAMPFDEARAAWMEPAAARGLIGLGTSPSSTIRLRWRPTVGS